MEAQRKCRYKEEENYHEVADIWHNFENDDDQKAELTWNAHEKQHLEQLRDYTENVYNPIEICHVFVNHLHYIGSHGNQYASNIKEILYFLNIFVSFIDKWLYFIRQKAGLDE